MSQSTAYHVIVLIAYAVILSLIYTFVPSVFKYQFTIRNSLIALGFFAVSVLLFYWIDSFWPLREIVFHKISFGGILLVSGYAIIFAAAEEIIFRGLIQKFFQTHLGSIPLAILVSALIFGLAHLANGAQGIAIGEWSWNFSILAALGGIPLGIAYTVTGELFAPTLVHALFLISLQLFTR